MESDKNFTYIRPAVEIYSLSSKVAILVGSETEHPVVVNNVTVEEFDDAGTFDLSF